MRYIKSPALLSVLFLMLIYSCSKNTDENNSIAATNPVSSPAFYYTDINPDLYLHSILSNSSNPNPFCDAIPTPLDSVIEYFLDLNNDSINDFSINIEHYVQNDRNNCQHCQIFYVKTIDIRPLKPTAYVSVSALHPYIARTYDTTEFITQSDIWVNYKMDALVEDICFEPTFNFQDAYFGLRLDSMLGYIHIERRSLNGVLIKEFGVNNTGSTQIIPGQQ